MCDNAKRNRVLIFWEERQTVAELVLVLVAVASVALAEISDEAVVVTLTHAAHALAAPAARLRPIGPENQSNPVYRHTFTNYD